VLTFEVFEQARERSGVDFGRPLAIMNLAGGGRDVNVGDRDLRLEI
jgi:hypothetical protein